ncbi:MAG: hypothetical protein EAX90_15475 [Candidatus Heimdallarchaeota archaeon]|nr:hypothetical protein [Candidatus Heimdallarchaeota archaeon]
MDLLYIRTMLTLAQCRLLQSEDHKMFEEKGYKLGKGTMQIKFDQKVPTTMINKILKKQK